MYKIDRKINDYSVIRVGSVVVLAFALVFTTFTFPLGIPTSADPIRNNPPNVPSNPGPANGLINVSVYAVLNWTGGDPDGDNVTYDVYFGNTSFPPIVSTNQTATTYNPGVMNYLTTYYWMIVAWDNQSNSTIGPQWWFTTKANVPPYMPSNPFPVNGSVNVSIPVILNWTGGDPDNDTVSYDVYFGNTSFPPIVSANQSATTYTPVTINYSTTYYWMIVSWDRNNSTVGPQWYFTTGVKPNTPPNTPSSPSPINAATNVLLNATLSWTGGDPDSGDTVLYDVYFGAINPPPKVKNNQTATTYTPGTMNYSTTYYWKIVAWDNHNASAKGPLWHFTTKQITISVTITQPLENTFYFQDKKIMSLPANTIIYGPITIIANVSLDTVVDRVEFWVDNNKKTTDTEAPYTYLWKPLIQFNGLSLKHTIKVIAYDSQGNNATAELNVTKWRFHALPWIIAGAAIGSRLILHTTVFGVVFNFQESKISTSFYVIRAHYRTVGPFKTARGVINYKHCTGGPLIGATSMTRFGPLHKFAIGQFTFIGNINYEKTGGFGQNILGNLLRNILSRR